MRRYLTLLSLTCSALALSGCQSVLTNLQGCERLYDGVANAGLGAGVGAGFSGTAKVYCPPPQGVAPVIRPAAAPTPAKPLGVGDKVG